jgi:tetratricopeptide (TPR) repeat protein
MPQSPESVRAQLETICRSTTFGPAPRLQKLLRYLAGESLAGSPLKESVVGVAVFGRDPGYDPKQDSVVRSEVRRLRVKLIEYYATEGRQDGTVIDLPKGSYVLTFRSRETSEPSPSAPPPASPHAEFRRAKVAASLSLVAAAAILTGYGLRGPGAQSSVAAHNMSPRRSVAVLDFRNLTARAETGWLSSAIPEMISADLAEGEQLRTIPGENVSRMETELALHPAGSPSRETLSAIRRNLGADIVISGAYADLGAAAGGRVRVDIRAEDAQTGDVVASVSESGTEPEILDLMSRAGARLRTGLRLEPSVAAEANMRAGSPQDPAAARAYADALAHLRRGDLLQARDLLLRCAQLEPTFAAAHAALSSAYTKLGYEALARAEAQRAYEFAASIKNADQRLAIEAQYRETDGDFDRSLEDYRKLFTAHPDDIESGLHLAAAQTAVAKTQDALRTLEALRKLPAPESNDPRVDMESARAYAARSDYRRSAELAADAVRKASGANAMLLYAHGLSYESGLLWNLGDARWRSLSEEARKICDRFQDQACVAAILRRFGNVSLGSLDLDAAERYYAEALGIARRIGSAAEESNILNGTALVAQGRGDLERSIAIQRQRLALSRKTQSASGEQQSLANLGDALWDAGEVGEARQSLEAALKIARDMHTPELIADDLTSLSEIYGIQGDLPRSLEASRRSASQCQAFWKCAHAGGRVAAESTSPSGARRPARRARSLVASRHFRRPRSGRLCLDRSSPGREGSARLAQTR